MTIIKDREGVAVEDLPLPADWVKLSDHELLYLGRAPVNAEGFGSALVDELISHPAVSAVVLDVTLRSGRRSLMSCEIVGRAHLMKYAPSYVWAERGIFLRMYAVDGDDAAYCFCAYLSNDHTGMLRRSLGVPADAPNGMDAKFQDVADRHFAAFCGLQLLLLHGGVTPYRRKARAPAKRMRTAARYTALPGKVRILELGARGAEIAAAVEKATAVIAPRVRRCACWKVRGHYRHYKSGAVVYVRPHVKGPERETAQVPGREYSLSKGGKV